MSSDYDASEFVDDDFQAHKPPHYGLSGSERAPTRAEVDHKVTQAQQELAEKKRELEECERKRAALEETRRRQAEFETGREEMVHHLTRGLGLLEESEFNARRDAEQMARTLNDLRDALSKIQAIQEDGWTKENLDVELTRALTVLENARMEWNAARLKIAVLSGPAPLDGGEKPAAAGPEFSFGSLTFGQLCRLGLALSWPITLVMVIATAVIIAVLRR
jgi:hypothetical protein